MSLTDQVIITAIGELLDEKHTLAIRQRGSLAAQPQFHREAVTHRRIDGVELKIDEMESGVPMLNLTRSAQRTR